jgi:hypothetical protein
MMRRLYERMSRINQSYGAFMDRIANVETFDALVFGVLFLGGAWALAWYAHIIFPWLEHLLGLGPYDIDSARKIQWRRIWSTAICLPGIIACIGLYIRNRRK